MRTVRTTIAGGLLALLCACAAQGPDSSESPQGRAADDAATGLLSAACLADPGSTECSCERWGNDTLACRCPAGEDSPECRVCTESTAPRLRVQAQIALARGQYGDGEYLLDCALAKRSGDRVAVLLRSQLADPGKFLNDSFGSGHTTYTTVYGDTLGKVAERCLGNALYFVALARYNDLEDPSKLVVGHDLKLPGMKACQVARVEVEAPRTAERAPPPELPAPAAPEQSTPPVQPETPVQPDERVVDRVVVDKVEMADSTSAQKAPGADTASRVDQLLEEFSDHVIRGEYEPACAKIDEILAIERHNEAALLHRSSFCE